MATAEKPLRSRARGIRSLPVALALALALVTSTSACNAILGIGDDPFRFVPDAASDPDASAPNDATPPARCSQGATLPTRPAVLDRDDGPRLTFALRRIDLSGRAADGGVTGFDLDGVCSCSATDDSAHAGAPSCTPPDASTSSGCDQARGIDNAIVGSGIDSLARSFGVALDEPTTHAACGRKTVIVLLDRYNGAADDPEISIAFVTSFGIKDRPDGGERLDASDCFGGTPPAPPWPGPPWPAKMDGTDVWTYRSADYNGKVPLRPVVGWVRDFRIVLDRRSTEGRDEDNLAFLVSDRVVPIGSPVMTAQLVPLDDRGLELAIVDGGIVGPSSEPVRAATFALRDGVVSGRVRAADLLSTLGAFKVSPAPDEKFLCNEPAFALAGALLCGSVDTMAVPSLDFRGQPCNAMSFVLQFDAVPAALGRASDAVQSDPCGVGFAAKCP